MIQQPVGFMRSVQGGYDAPAALSAVSTPEGLRNGWAVPRGALSNEKEGIAKGRVATLGELTCPVTIAALLVNGVESSKGPNMVSGWETLDIADSGPVPSSMIDTHAGYA